MCPVYVAFSTPKKPIFNWTDTFKDIKDPELEELIIECRGALHSLEAELADRQNPQVNTTLNECYTRLENTVRTINESGTLDKRDRACLKKECTSLEALKSGQIHSSQTRKTRWNGGIYEQTLWLTSRIVGPAYALLLICGMTRRIVQRMTSSQSAILVKYMAQNYDSLSSRALEAKAVEFGLYKTSLALSIT